MTTITRPIFIVGPGRSGTTLLRSLLSAHSRIAVTPETQFMSRAKMWGLANGAPSDFDAFWKNYTSWLRFRDLGVDPNRCRQLIEMHSDYSFAAIFRTVLYAYGDRVGKVRVGEKTPSHVHYLPYILDWFPDAQVIVTQRDPRAVLASQINTYYIKKKLTPRSLRQGFFIHKKEQQIVFLAKEWETVFETTLKPWSKDPRFYTVVYEKLVQNVEEETRAIFNFLGEAYEPTVLTERSHSTVPLHAAQYDDGLMEQWRLEHHAKTLQPVSPNSLDKWKSQLTQADLALIEGCCGKTMQRLGYTPSLTPRLQSLGRTAASLLASSATAETQIREIASQGKLRFRTTMGQAATIGVTKGVPPAWFGYRRMVHETVQEYFLRHDGAGSNSRYETIHPDSLARNPLPCNVSSRKELPDDRGWWGYSFRDVPQRTSGETFMATLPNCLIASYKDPEKGNDFFPAILNGDSRALDMREIKFRPLHALTLRQSPRPVKLKKATWIAERVYHNHSHWLTAHLPKLLLLRERQMLDEVLLPLERTEAMDGSLRLLGMNPEQFQIYNPARPLFVENLTIIGTDRFRPELLQMIPKALGINDTPSPSKKVFISRSKAKRRRLVNEDPVWALFEEQGFERVFMEEMSFADQVNLMRETAILAAPHGAGLTNMVFCPKGAQIVEIADLSFPNPNFYALASAMGHDYWLIRAESVGDLHPLEKDLRVDPAAVSEIVARFVTG